MLPVLILAGGLATRLRPLTERIPKALVPVANKPFVIHQLEFLKGQGIRKVILCTGYRADQIKAVVGNGSAYGLEVSYSEDGDTLLGTGGAIIKALPLAGSAFFVLYGDSFLPISFAEVESEWRRSQKPALMSVFRNEGQWDSSNVLFEDQTVIEYDKHRPRPSMNYIDYGLAVLSADLFSDRKPAIPFDLADLYHDLSLSRRLAGMEVFERFYEIGSPEGLAEAEAYFGRA
ncbi:MAG: nucleotidyl transferase [Candidatus Pelagibacter sp. TMED64]|nr:MAG: nucleotidyl transferase [Candidatus Pelagibacter sp. TMED64]